MRTMADDPTEEKKLPDADELESAGADPESQESKEKGPKYDSIVEEQEVNCPPQAQPPPSPCPWGVPQCPLTDQSQAGSGFNPQAGPPRITLKPILGCEKNQCLGDVR